MLVPVTRGTCASEKILAWQGCLPVLDSELAHTALANPTRTWPWRKAGTAGTAGQHGTWKQRMGGFCGITKSKAEQGRGVIRARSRREVRVQLRHNRASPSSRRKAITSSMGWHFDIPGEGEGCGMHNAGTERGSRSRKPLPSLGRRLASARRLGGVPRMHANFLNP